MFASITGAEKKLLDSVNRIPQFFWKNDWANKINLTTEKIEQDNDGAYDLAIEKSGGDCRIEYRSKVHLFRGLALLKERCDEESFLLKQKMHIPEIGVMIGGFAQQRSHRQVFKVNS